MKCAQCRPRLAALAGGDLGTAESARYAAHLASCAACAEELGALRQTVALLRRVGRAEPLPADFRAALHRRLAAEPPPRRPWSRQLWQFLEWARLDSGRRIARRKVRACSVGHIAGSVGDREGLAHEV